MGSSARYLACIIRDEWIKELTGIDDAKKKTVHGTSFKMASRRRVYRFYAVVVRDSTSSASIGSIS